tara:strand:- start:556 stop:984 length:429 start_codon:yes stop_codon:yes gene_type:complete
MIEFNINEINPIQLHDRATNEAKKIATNTSFKMSGRTYEDLIRQCRRGHAAEIYLIDILGWEDDEREYKDVIDPDGYEVEVKVTGDKGNIPIMLERFKDIKENQQWMNWPDHLIIFINPEDSNEYSYHGRYEWKKDQWRLQH